MRYNSVSARITSWPVSRSRAAATIEAGFNTTDSATELKARVDPNWGSHRALRRDRGKSPFSKASVIWFVVSFERKSRELKKSYKSYKEVIKFVFMTVKGAIMHIRQMLL
jgi:hypothetical protein